MSKIDLHLLETSLKKRWKDIYNWKGTLQNNDWDSKTNFIYNTRSYNELLQILHSFDDGLRNYALNRWYNFWSAMGIEQLFSAHKAVVQNQNKFDKLSDFSIDKIPFDHKSSVYPRGFNKPFSYAQNHKIELIEWLYKNQSQEGRKHLRNRIFTILYDSDKGEHWKLKAEINLIKIEIDRYVNGFSKENLPTFNFGEGKVFSDIIWIVK